MRSRHAKHVVGVHGKMSLCRQGRRIESGATVTISGRYETLRTFSISSSGIYEAREMSSTSRGIDGSDSLADKYARTRSGQNA
jgi:hypothetical protein